MNKCKHWKKDEISGLCPTCAFQSQKVQRTAITNWWSQTDVPRSWTTRPIRFPLILLLKDWVTGSLNRYTQFKELSLTYATYAIIISSQYCHFDLSAGPVFQLQCGHVYHTDCLKKWFEQRASCPVCLKKFGKVVSWQNLASQELYVIPASDESHHFSRPSNTLVLQH